MKSAAHSGAVASQVKTSQLPIRRVLLYKNGVGFFEHVGKVTGNQRVSIDFMRKEQQTLRDQRAAAERDLSEKIMSLQLDEKQDS